LGNGDFHKEFRSSEVQEYAYGTLREQEYAYGTLREQKFRSAWESEEMR
jgi:hypothetical protein